MAGVALAHSMITSKRPHGRPRLSRKITALGSMRILFQKKQAAALKEYPETTNLSPHEVRGIRAIFNTWDKDGGGSLAFDEINALWTADPDFAVMTTRLEDLFEELDSDGDNHIDFTEFLTVINLRVPPSAGPSEAEARPAKVLFLDALRSVQDEIEAVYGSTKKPQSIKEQRDAVYNTIQSRFFFFAPDSTFKSLWDTVQVLSLLYIGIMVPLRLCFSDLKELSPPDRLFWAEAAMDFLFIVDVVVNFRTAAYTQYGDIEVDRTVLAKQYIRSWFLIDVVACLPLRYVVLVTESVSKQQDPGGGTSTSTGFKALKILRLLRLAKMLRLGAMVQKIKNNDQANGTKLYPVVRVLILVLIICFIAHVFACAWYVFGQDTWENGVPGTPEYQVHKGWVNAKGWLPGRTNVSTPGPA